MLHSGKTSMLLYRDEIESSLRTQNLAGIQLLDLHDFPGQSTADVGMLDCFWDDKGIVSSRRFREFSNRVVPLLVLQKRIFISAEAMDIKIFIANYLPTDLINKIVKLTIESKTFRFEKQLYLDTIHHGNVFEYFDDVITLPVVEDATTLECVLSISDTPYQNRWNITVLPDEPVDDVLLFTDISDEFLTAIKQGKNMIFNSPLHAVKDAVPGKFFPVFWSPVHFTSYNPNLLIILH